MEPTPEIRAEENILVSEPILKKITGLNQPDGFAAEIDMPPPQDVRGQPFLLVLDRIADPGNLGTLFRTALALNWGGVILTPGTVDLFNDKALRAGKGAQVHLPYMYLTPEEIIQIKTCFYTADLEGEPLGASHFSPPLALILSHEGQGAGCWSEPSARKISIPMNRAVESLNVAASGAILLYIMRLE